MGGGEYCVVEVVCHVLETCVCVRVCVWYSKVGVACGKQCRKYTLNPKS